MRIFQQCWFQNKQILRHTLSAIHPFISCFWEHATASKSTHIEVLPIHTTHKTHTSSAIHNNQKEEMKKTICLLMYRLCAATLTGEQRLHNRILIETMLVLMFFHHASGGLVRFSRTRTRTESWSGRVLLEGCFAKYDVMMTIEQTQLTRVATTSRLIWQWRKNASLAEPRSCKIRLAFCVRDSCLCFVLKLVNRAIACVLFMLWCHANITLSEQHILSYSLHIFREREIKRNTDFTRNAQNQHKRPRKVCL